MIAMPSASGAGAAAGMPAGVPAGAAPAAAGAPAADQAFDDVFRQLTGGLLSTAAVAGEAAPEIETDEVEGLGEIVDGEAPLAGGTVTAPIAFTLPVVAPAAAEGSGAGVAGIAPDEAGTSLTAATTATTATAAGAASSPVAAAREGAGATPTTGLPPAPEAAVETTELPAETAGARTPSTEVEAHVRGLDRRRGMRETPAPARTFDGAAAAAASETSPSVAAPAVPEAATAPSTSAPTSPREMPAHAERMFALQRALARQTASDHRDQPAPGLVAQVLGEAVVPAGQSGDAAADASGSGRRQGRAWMGTLPAGTPIAAAGAAVAAEAASSSSEGASLPGPAAGAAWRAALASTAVAEALTPAAAAVVTPGAPSHLAAVLAPIVEAAHLRDRAPIEVDMPAPAPELDAATAESVRTQIVKSIRMQWTGGLGEARVTLRPEYLGEVVATIKVDQGVVTATLHADTPDVRRWMESHTATLRDALVEQGLKLDRLTVSEPERQAAQGDRQGKPRQRQQDAPRPRAPRGTSDTDTPFEVTTE